MKIKEIEILNNIGYDKNKIGDSPLELWYDNIRDKDIVELTDADILRMLRQDVFITYITGEISNRLKNNPMLGEQLSGEMLITLSELKIDFWRNNPTFKNDIIKIANDILSSDIILEIEELFDFEKDEIVEILQKIINL